MELKKCTVFLANTVVSTETLHQRLSQRPGLDPEHNCAVCQLNNVLVLRNAEVNVVIL